MNSRSKTTGKQPGRDNLKGKGFDAHPENINREGRPRKVESIPDILRMIGEEVDPKTGKPNLETVMRIVYKKALAGAAWAVTFIAERCEGRVAQQIITEMPKKPETPLSDCQLALFADLLDGDPDGEVKKYIEEKQREVAGHEK